MTHRGKPVEPSKITRVALMTVEGENDDISGLGQTEATHEFVHARSRRIVACTTCRKVSGTTACSTVPDSVGNRAAHLTTS